VRLPTAGGIACRHRAPQNGRTVARAKNGSQQTTNVPVMTASVRAALRSRRPRPPSSGVNKDLESKVKAKDLRHQGLKLRPYGAIQICLLFIIIIIRKKTKAYDRHEFLTYSEHLANTTSKSLSDISYVGKALYLDYISSTTQELNGVESQGRGQGLYVTGSTMPSRHGPHLSPAAGSTLSVATQLLRVAPWRRTSPRQNFQKVVPGKTTVIIIYYCAV